MIFHKVCNRLKYILDSIYSYYKSLELHSVGTGFRVRYPMHLHEGELIHIGRNFSADRRLRLEAFDVAKDKSTKIYIGNNVRITWDCHIGAISRIEIHDNVLIGSRVLITDHMHGKIESKALDIIPVERPLWSKGPVIIAENVWIGEGVAIMPGVTIGRNAIIGANSVVTSSIPENCVAAGIPARVIRTL